MNQAAKFDLSIIGMPKQHRTERGWIGFGPKTGKTTNGGSVLRRDKADVKKNRTNKLTFYDKSNRNY
jgi:hypothetical protein